MYSFAKQFVEIYGANEDDLEELLNTYLSMSSLVDFHEYIYNESNPLRFRKIFMKIFKTYIDNLNFYKEYNVKLYKNMMDSIFIGYYGRVWDGSEDIPFDINPNLFVEN